MVCIEWMNYLEFKPKDLIIYIYIFSIIFVQFLNQNGLYRMNESVWYQCENSFILWNTS